MAVGANSGKPVIISRVNSQPPTRLATSVPTHSSHQQPEASPTRDDRRDRHQEVLGEQLAPGQQQRDEPDAEGQPRQQLAARLVHHEELARTPVATSMTAARPVASSARSAAAAPATLVDRPQPGVLDRPFRHQGSCSGLEPTPGPPLRCPSGLRGGPCAPPTRGRGHNPRRPAPSAVAAGSREPEPAPGDADPLVLLHLWGVPTRAAPGAVLRMATQRRAPPPGARRCGSPSCSAPAAAARSPPGTQIPGAGACSPSGTTPAPPTPSPRGRWSAPGGGSPTRSGPRVGARCRRGVAGAGGNRWPARPQRWNGPVAALTRARLVPGGRRTFWRAVPPVSADLHEARGSRLALGTGRRRSGCRAPSRSGTAAEAPMRVRR